MRATCHDGDHDFAVSNVRGLVHPTALHAGSRIHLGQGRKNPSAPSPTASLALDPAVPQAQEHRLPTLRRLPKPRIQG